MRPMEFGTGDKSLSVVPGSDSRPASSSVELLGDAGLGLEGKTFVRSGVTSEADVTIVTAIEATRRDVQR